MEFYPPQPDGEPPAPAVITNTFMVYTREENGVTQFLQVSGNGCNDDEARGYPSHDFPSLEAAKEYIKALNKNFGLWSVSWFME
jgi:hypothetical protein